VSRIIGGIVEPGMNAMFGEAEREPSAMGTIWAQQVGRTV
jgi:hypothetical protein